MGNSLDQSLSNFRDIIFDKIKTEKNISITTHIDCDGLTSGSIITKALLRAGAKCTLRTSNEFNSQLIDSMKNDERDFHIVTDLGGGFGNELDESLGENWFVLDHHEIEGDELDNPRVINAWKYGMDGGTEICAGGMSYLAAKTLDGKNEDLAGIAVVSALGDRQDQGEKRSFTGMNSEISKTAKDSGQITVDMDLLLVGRETRPLANALAFTAQPFIEGLTWHRDTCLNLFNSAGINLKEDGRWRVPAELTDDEKKLIIEEIVKFSAGENSTEIMETLIGHTYVFPNEDKRSFLRDAREFATMLNSCGRIRKSGVGMAICMGDRNKMFIEGEKILAEYRKMIRNYMDTLSNERWRTQESKNCVMIDGKNLVPETMTGTISSLVAGAPKNLGKIVILRTNTEQGSIKFSSRKSTGCKSEINLSAIMRKGAEQFEGVGGGHEAAAGAKITKDKLDGFLDYLEENVVNV